MTQELSFRQVKEPEQRKGKILAAKYVGESKIKMWIGYAKLHTSNKKHRITLKKSKSLHLHRSLKNTLNKSLYFYLLILKNRIVNLISIVVLNSTKKVHRNHLHSILEKKKV